MREIKYRAWDKKNKKFLEGWESAYMDIWDGAVYELNGGFDDIDATMDYLDLEIQQYTGLKDKDGTEIYEGDIVKFTNKKGVEIISEVVFYDGVFELTNYDYRNCTDESCINCYELLKWVAWNCEVIGNIYQNKDLLK